MYKCAGLASRRIFLSLLFAGLTSSRGQLLYDGALNSVPGNQNWVSVTFGASQTLTNSGVLLDTSAAGSLQAGYSRTTPRLNRAEGFALLFTVQLIAEAHANNNRAGFSVIVLAEDKRGIELAFWTNTIFAQSDSPLFTHAEENNFSTTALVDYTLTFHGSGYALSANGAPILSGPVRDYSAFSGFPNPYSSTNFLFFGDDTTSAAGAVLLKRVTLITAPQLRVLADRVVNWTGVSNQTYTVLTSSNLFHWSAAGSATSATTNFVFTNSSSASAGYLRVVFP